MGNVRALAYCPNARYLQLRAPLPGIFKWAKNHVQLTLFDAAVSLACDSRNMAAVANTIVNMKRLSVIGAKVRLNGV